MLALSTLDEGFARGLVSLHSPPLLGRKTSSAKSRVSISSKLIEIKGFQLQYFGHLRKTGGRGSYRLVHATHYPAELRPHAPVRLSQKRTSPLPVASANLYGRRPPRSGRSASALGVLFPRSSLLAVDCRLSASSFPLTPVFLPLARPSFKSSTVYQLHNIGGRGWRGPTNWSIRPASLITITVLTLCASRIRSASSLVAGHWSPLPLHWPPVAGRWSLVTLRVPLRSSPLGARITTLLEPETFRRSPVSNT
jgi:hypothetical protein